MGTLVLLAAFLLVASATPIQPLTGDSPDDYQDQHEDGSAPEQPSVSEAVSTGSQEHPSGTHSHGTSNNNANSVPPSPSSSENTAVTSAVENSPDSGVGDTSQNDGDDSPASHSPSENNSATSDADQPADATPGHSSDNDVTHQPSSHPSTQDDSATSKEPEYEIPSSTDNSKPPLDGDPKDCNITDGADHVYLSCQFMCSGDEMEVARDNASCYLNQTETTVTPFGVRNRMESNETGICRDGYCVHRSTVPPASLPATESSTSFSSTETTTSTSTSEISTNTSTTVATRNDSQDTTTVEYIAMP